MKEIVYFIQAGDNGPIKIGKAKNLKRRMESIRTHCPYPIKLLAIDIYRLEREWHLIFKDHRLKGEWFKPHDDILTAISGLIVKKGTIRCQWCHVAMDAEKWICPKCSRKTCYVNWYNERDKKACRIFQNEDGKTLGFDTALRILVEINYHYAEAKDPNSPIRFSLKKWSDNQTIKN